MVVEMTEWSYYREYVVRVLEITSRYETGESLLWKIEDGRPIFYILCSDEFDWGTADSEEITPENLDILEKSYEDINKIKDNWGYVYGTMLFVARVRGVRPQGAAYPDEQKFWPLFDACGPERELGPGNPYQPGERKR